MEGTELALARLRMKTSSWCIAHLSESDGPGGAERVIAHLATVFAAQGHKVLVVVPEKGEGWLTRELAHADVVMERFRLEREYSPPALMRLARLLRRHGTHIAHCHDFNMAVCGAFAARLAGARQVITMHGSTYYAARLRRRLALRAGAALSDALVAVSRPLASHLASHLNLREQRVTVIPNGVKWDPPPRLTLRDELGLGPADRLLLAVGNLYPVKGHRWLLEALRWLDVSHPTAHLAIAGRGPEEAPLRDQARRLGLSDRLHLLGLRSDVANLLCSADLYVHPSDSEGLPLAMLEAMWAERPIVATAVGEVPVALGDGAGLLVAPGDSRALAGAIDRLLREPQTAARLSRRAAERARAEYGVETMARRYGQIYDRLLRAPAAEPQTSRDSSKAPAAVA